jgi:hypothetical protein
MAVGLGVTLILVAGTAMAAVMFVLWGRLPASLAFAGVIACSLLIATGALLVQDEVDGASWVIALSLLGVLGPLHARLLLGSPGTARGG